jgi:hypothetical protein
VEAGEGLMQQPTAWPTVRRPAPMVIGGAEWRGARRRRVGGGVPSGTACGSWRYGVALSGGVTAQQRCDRRLGEASMMKCVIPSYRGKD